MTEPTYGPQARNSFKNMKKTFADHCLEIAESATPSPWKAGVSYHYERNAQFIAESREMVPELARRLKISNEIILRLSALLSNHGELYDIPLILEWLDELEEMPEGEK